MLSPTLLVLAAGSGSRYGGFKLNDPVGPNGENLLDYSIYDASRAGFIRFVFVIRHEIEQAFKDMIAAHLGRRFPVEYVYQSLPKIPPGLHVPPGRTKPWGTTHAILTAASAIYDPFAVINVGDFYGAESYRALVHHLQSGTSDYATVGFVLRHTLSEFGSVARGICQVDDNGFLESLVEHKNIERQGGHAVSTDPQGCETKLTGDEIVSMNMWGFTPRIFGQLEEQFRKFLEIYGSDQDTECLIPNTVNALVVCGKARVRVLRCGDPWFGVTYRDDHTRAVENVRHLIQEGHYPKRLW